MSHVIPAWSIPSVAVIGETGTFPVRRIYCVGRNYAAHAREMGHSGKEDPFFFCKPADAIVPSGAIIPYPSSTKNLHHEIELVVALKSGGRNIASAKALDHIYGYAVGLDMTRRDVQEAAKKAGRPWDNGQTKQEGDLADMIWNVPDTIAYLSGLVELAAGDLIYTGTPEGVGPVVAGDRMDGHVDGVGDIAITYAKA
jgi:fumarylpyruvate hydrolase